MTEMEAAGLYMYDPVTYVPSHAEGNAGHPDCELGVFIQWTPGKLAKVLYCSARTVQRTDIKLLVIG